MEPSFEIKITGFTNPTEFVERWSSIYSYGNEPKYENYIATVLDNKESFLGLFRWKNSTWDKISINKQKMDESFFSFGQFLKGINTQGIEVRSTK